MIKKLHVLIVEDLPSDTELAQRELKTVLENFSVQEVDTEEGFLQAMDTFKPDLIISDYSMPSFDGLSALKHKQEKAPFIPFIILTGSMNEDTAVECMKAGADDYVIKEHIKRLGPAVISALEKKKIERERIRAVAALQEERDNAKKYLDIAEVLFVARNIKGEVTLINRKGSTILGYEKDEIIGKNWFDNFLPKSIREKARALFSRLMAGDIQLIEYCENPIVTKDGEERLIAWHNSILKNDEGNIIGTLSSGEDITERKRAEEALMSHLDQTRKLRDMVEKLNRADSLEDAYSVTIQSILTVIKADRASILLVDAVGRVRFKAWEGLSQEYRMVTEGHFPWEISDLKAQPICISDIMKADLPEELRATILKDGIHACAFIPLIGKNQLLGKFMMYHNQIHTYESDEINIAKVIAANLSTVIERIQSQAALIESETKFRTVFEGSRAAIYISSVEGDFVDFNPFMEQMLGYRREELFSIPLIELSVNKDDRIQLQRLIKSQGFVKDYELQFIKKDGALIDCLETTTAHRDGDGNIIGYQGIIRDISERNRERKKLERALEEAKQGERVKSLFMANMSHEIRTPLNAILGFIELIEGSTRHLLPDAEKEFFDVVRKSGNRLMQTVHEILDISQIEAGTYQMNPEIFDLCRLIEDIVKECKLQAYNKGLKLEYQCDGTSAFIQADHWGLAQAIRNITENAIKYTEQGRVTVSLQQEAKCFILSIRDTGIGIAKEYLDDLFEVFSQESEGYTKKYQGIGLGMAITKRYLDLNQVKIEVESTKGVGTTFILTFKPVKKHISEKQVKKGIIDDLSITEKADKPLVLLVEDDPDSQKLIEYFLKEKYELCFAISVEEAKQLLKKYKIDLILLDLSLPGKEDGLDLVRWMRKTKTWKKTPAIATTVHAFTSDREKCLAAGCNDYISKPIIRKKLNEKIRKVLE